MGRTYELRMTLVIILVGVFFISGCFFNDKHTVTFKTNGGSEVKNVSVKSGAKLDDVETPTKNGYIFDGWYLDGEEFNFDTKVDEDITLVAKWIKESFDENNVSNETTSEAMTSTTTEITTKGTKTTTSKTTKKVNSSTKKTTKKKTSTTKKTTSTTKKITSTTKKPTTTTQTVKPTESVTPTKPIVDIPIEKPTIPVTPIVPTTKPIDINITLVKEVELDEGEAKDKELTEEIEYLIVTRTLENVNVVSEISETDLDNLLKSDMSMWHIISNHAFVYEYTLENNQLLLKGDKDVTSFTVSYDGSSFIFEYNEENENWIIKYPTVSVGTGLNVNYYNNIETAISVAKKDDEIKLLKDQVVETNLKLTVPVIIDGSNYKISNKEGFLFNLEDLEYDKTTDIIIKDLVLDVDSFIFLGKSKFDSIILENVTGSIRGEKLDREIKGLFINTELLQQL